MSVLGGHDIERRFGEIFADGTADTKRIRGAKYYLTLGNRFLILPGGERYPGEEQGLPARHRPFALEPGQTAFVSTKEALTMPPDLSGIFGPSLGLSDNGLLFFGGMLVDPWFGYSGTEDPEPTPEPLSFYVANVGSTTHQLRPGEQNIASIAFLKVSREDEGPRVAISNARKVREEMFDPRRHDRPNQALGLVEDISQIRERVQRFEESTKQVVLFGVLVLAATLFAAIVSLLSSEAGKSIELDLQWYEVIPALYLVAAIPVAFSGGFYMWADMKLKRQKQRYEAPEPPDVPADA